MLWKSFGSWSLHSHRCFTYKIRYDAFAQRSSWLALGLTKALKPCRLNAQDRGISGGLQRLPMPLIRFSIANADGAADGAADALPQILGTFVYIKIMPACSPSASALDFPANSLLQLYCYCRHSWLHALRETLIASAMGWWSPSLRGTFVASVGRLLYVGPMPQLFASAMGLWSPQLCETFVASTGCFHYVGPRSPSLWDLSRLRFGTVVASAMGSWSPPQCGIVVSSATWDLTWDLGRLRYVGPWPLPLWNRIRLRHGASVASSMWDLGCLCTIWDLGRRRSTWDLCLLYVVSAMSISATSLPNRSSPRHCGDEMESWRRYLDVYFSWRPSLVPCGGRRYCHQGDVGAGPDFGYDSTASAFSGLRLFDVAFSSVPPMSG